MKILVINGSPRGADSNTDVLVKAFLEGACETGAESEIVYLKDKKIAHCNGCFACWTKTPGICVHHDDMTDLLVKMTEADVIVYATPLYIYTFTGMMKDFLDRSIPLAMPFIEEKDGLCNHPRRNQEKPQRIVLISNCGFIEQEHFSGLKETVRCCFRDDTRELAGMICCAGGEMLHVPELRDGIGWYLDAVKCAGRQVVCDGKIDAETQSIIDKPLMEDKELFLQSANAHFREQLGLVEEKSPASAECAPCATPLGPPESIETIRDLIAGFALAYNPAKGKDLKTVIQFDITDEEPGMYHVSIADGKCTSFEGTASNAAVTITSPSDVWLKIARGELNGATAFMKGMYKVKGDMSLLMRLNDLFGK